MTNSLFVISPYRYEEMWVFDDSGVGLAQEPFVSGTDTMIDHLVRDIPNADQGFRLIFSASAFPGYSARLEWSQAELSGTWYAAPEWGMEGWLCPALFKYFAEPPAEIYVKAEARQERNAAQS